MKASLPTPGRETHDHEPTMETLEHKHEHSHFYHPWVSFTCVMFGFEEFEGKCEGKKIEKKSKIKKIKEK